MKIRAVSDIHLEMCETEQGVPNLGEGDVLILGGDILCARHLKTNGKLHKVYLDFLNKCVNNFEHVLYIQGNHESYGLNINNTLEILKESFPPSIHILENDKVQIGEWIFIGCTLWSDFMNENALEMLDASRFMNDYRKIKIDSTYRKLRPEDTLYLHKRSRRYLEETLQEHKNDKVWVMTHHAPSFQSIHERYKNESCNGSYASNLDDLIFDNPQIKYFSHGHTHCSLDYTIGDCRVLCNPRGYYNGYNSSGQNPVFNPHLTITI
jgi:predicted phosphodiesterase